mgnify:FL=1
MEISMADVFRKERFTAKEDILEWIKEARKRIIRKSEIDKKHSAAYYHIYQKMLEEFYDRIKQTKLFNRLEDFWYYTISFSDTGAKLFLCYADKCEFDDKGHVIQIGQGQSLPLIIIPAKNLTVEEYANMYGVGVGTVRQWIRRGKIRNAKKRGREWLIPELTELPGRGYQSGVYEWFEYLEDLPEEYEFLRNYTVVIINQNRENKKLYEVTFAAGGVIPEKKEYNEKERERLELFLISHPQIHFIGLPDDGLNLQISSKGYYGIDDDIPSNEDTQDGEGVLPEGGKSIGS